MWLLYAEIRTIQDRIQEESRWLFTVFWEKKIGKLNIEYNNPTKFWRDIAKLQGSNKQMVPYLKDEQGNKVTDKKDKEKLFTETWS